MLLKLSPEQKKLIVEISNILVGLPYKFGAEVDLKLRPEEVKAKNLAFDCSELIEYIYYQIGYKVPDGSYNQFNASEYVDEAQIGDIVFKRDKNTKQINHSGLIVSETEPIVFEAEGWYQKVIKRPLKEFMKSTTKTEFAGIKRFITDQIKIL